VKTKLLRDILANWWGMLARNRSVMGADEETMGIDRLKQIAEATLLAAGRPLTLDQILVLFAEQERPDRNELRKALSALEEDLSTRGIELVQVASGYRIQVRQEMQLWVSRLWEEKPTRYSRALLETMALIAYRQPITRGEIEEVRGVSAELELDLSDTIPEAQLTPANDEADAPVSEPEVDAPLAGTEEDTSATLH
jgi:hypothetical protein